MNLIFVILLINIYFKTIKSNSDFINNTHFFECIYSNSINLCLVNLFKLNQNQNNLYLKIENNDDPYFTIVSSSSFQNKKPTDLDSSESLTIERDQQDPNLIRFKNTANGNYLSSDKNGNLFLQTNFNPSQINRTLEQSNFHYLILFIA